MSYIYAKVQFKGKIINSEYHCRNCDCVIDEDDFFCRKCGINFYTGIRPEETFKAGYEAAKDDMIKLLKGGKK